MGEAREQDMLKFFQLTGQCAVDSRIAVAEQVDPPRADGVQVALAFEVFKPHALATADRDNGEPFMVLHLCARMPHNGQVSFYQVVILHIPVILESQLRTQIPALRGVMVRT